MGTGNNANRAGKFVPCRPFEPSDGSAPKSVARLATGRGLRVRTFRHASTSGGRSAFEDYFVMAVRRIYILPSILTPAATKSQTATTVTEPIMALSILFLASCAFWQVHFYDLVQASPGRAQCGASERSPFLLGARRVLKMLPLQQNSILIGASPPQPFELFSNVVLTEPESLWQVRYSIVKTDGLSASA